MALRRSVQFIFLLITALLFVSCTGNSDEPENGTPLIFAAASLADVLGEGAAMYEAETGKRLDFSFGGSIAMANQIATFGAPADGVFFVGDEPMAVLAQADLEPRAGWPALLFNSMVVIGSSDQDPLGALEELGTGNSRIAIGDPALAPAGVYAQQALESAGIWDAVSDRIIFTLDVRAAMAAVASGNARYGIVYRTDAMSSHSSDVQVLYEFENPNFNIRYSGGSVNNAPNAVAAQDFIDFLAHGPKTLTLFESAGFSIGGRLGNPG